jgi:hypothetical protein
MTPLRQTKIDETMNKIYGGLIDHEHEMNVLGRCRT